MHLYHGSGNIINKPLLGKGRVHNDYGQGLYLTKNKELAKEWSVSENRDGYINEYELDVSNLKVLDLTSHSYSVLHWLALLVKNRTFDVTSNIMKEAKSYLLDNFLINLDEYDVVIGYRADDSYFSFAKDFLSNTITLEKLKYAMRLGKLGIQVFIKSEKAFSSIRFLGHEKVNKSEYYNKKILRDIKARNEYVSLKEDILNGIYMIDVLKERMKENDSRLY